MPAPTLRHKRYRAVILVMLACSILCALGTWQVKRLHWKQGLIATLEQRLSAPAVDFTALPQPYADQEWRRVIAQGRFVQGRDMLVAPRTHNGQVGAHVFSVFELRDGGRILVNRGFVAQGADVSAAQLDSVEGVVRQPARSRFTPDNAPQTNTWYWPDAGAMLAGDGITDVYMQMSPVDGLPKTQPQPVATMPEIANNHAQYAAFWFGMAGLCLLIFVLARKKGYA